MTFIEFFKQQFIEEGATTRKMLSRVPDKQTQARACNDMNVPRETRHPVCDSSRHM